MKRVILNEARDFIAQGLAGGYGRTTVAAAFRSRRKKRLARQTEW